MTSVVNLVPRFCPTPRPGATVLDSLRRAQFTGRVTFSEDPLLHVYLDGGHVYFTEKPNDPTIVDMLFELDLLSRGSAADGIVTIDGRQDIGFLFERVPSLDRHVALVALERRCQNEIVDLSTRTITRIAGIPNLMQSNGLRRWWPASYFAPVPVDGIEDLWAARDGDSAAWTDPQTQPDEPTPLATPEPTMPVQPETTAAAVAANALQGRSQAESWRSNEPADSAAVPSNSNADISLTWTPVREASAPQQPTTAEQERDLAVRSALAAMDSAFAPPSGAPVQELHGQHSNVSDSRTDALERLIGGLHADQP